MLLQSQELTNINSGINKSSEINVINISKKQSEDAIHKEKSGNNSLVDAHDFSDQKKNETLEIMKSKNFKQKQSLKVQKSLKKTNLNPLFMFEDITDSLNNIISIFLDRHSNQDKVAEFKKSNIEFKGSVTLLKVFEEFEDFNFFDMISSNEFLIQDEEKKKKLIVERNNFFLRVLSNLEELNIKVDHLVNNFVMLYTDVVSEIEVDYFFLCFYDYNDMAESLVLKHNEYFKSLLNNNSNDEVKKFFKNYRPKPNPLKSANENNSNSQITDVEVNFVKSVINSCIKRNFHEGILKLFDIDSYYSIVKDVEFWEKCILGFTPNKIYDIWKKYFERFSLNKNKTTIIQVEEKIKVDVLTLKNNPQKEKPKPKVLQVKIDENFQLNDFTDFFLIIHTLLKKKEIEAYDKRIVNSIEVKSIKEVAFHFLEVRGKCCKLSQAIFEYSMDIDEDLGCAIIDQVIDSNNVKKEYMLKAIEKKYFRIAFPLSKFKQCKELLYTLSMQDLLLRYLRYGEYVYYALCLFSSINDNKLITENSDKICKSFLILIRDEEGISRSRHPIITCVLGAEFLYRLGRLNVKFQYKCHSIADMLVDMGQYLQEAIKEEESLNFYLRTQIDDKGRSALEIIAENRFYQLLQDENVAAIVSKLWYGQGQTISLLKFCRIYSIVSSNISHEHYSNVVSRDTKEYNNKAFSFQFTQYIKNCSVRYLVDSVSTILTTVLYQVIIYAYVLIMQSSTPFPNQNSVFSYSKIIADIVVFSINLNLFCYLIYVYKSNRKLHLTIFILLDILLTIAVFIDIIQLPQILFAGDDVTTQLVTAIIYSFIIVCAWLRVTNILITTRTFGPFLRIIYLILGMMINFMIIFSCFNTISAQVFTLLFHQSNTDFNAFFTSWVTLFMAAFGLYNFGNFTDALYLGYALLIVFITITNLMLLNLIVSIISHQYEEYEALADSENRAVLVLTYERIKWDDKYGLLILLPAPFNLMSVFLIVILFFVPETRRVIWNKRFSQWSYIVIAIANFSVLLGISFICYPLALIKSYVHSIYDGWNNFSAKTVHKTLFYAFFRPFELLGYIFVDVTTFWKYCYVENKEEGEGDKKNFKMPKESIKYLRAIFEIKMKQRKKTVHVSEIYEKINQEKKLMTTNTFTNVNASVTGSITNPTASINYTLSVSNNNLNISGDLKTRNELYISIKNLCEKLMDKDEFIDAERAFLILPKRIKYSDHFIDGINSLNMKQMLKGLRKYFFMNSVNNPIYSYRKLQQMIYKIMIKFKMIIQMIPDQYGDNLVNNFEEENKKYDKIVIDALIKKEEIVEEKENNGNLVSDDTPISNEDTNINKNSKKFFDGLSDGGFKV